METYMDAFGQKRITVSEALRVALAEGRLGYEVFTDEDGSDGGLLRGADQRDELDRALARHGKRLIDDGAGYAVR